MKRRLIPIALAGLAGLAIPAAGSAHHTTVQCARPGYWTVENSEAIPATFTTNRGHAGTLGPRQTVEVPYSGTSLTVSAVWANGNTAINTGTGPCTLPDPTTTTTTTSTSSTTTSTTSSTSSTVAPTSSVPSSTPSTSSLPSPSSSDVPPAASSLPVTTSTSSVPSSPTSSVSPAGSSTTPAPSAPADPAAWTLPATR